jgi:hypothetical protein
MHAAVHGGVTWVGDVSPERMAFAAARNAVVANALTTEADAIFWCDDDVELPVDAISRLVAHRLDFVTGILCQRVAPHWPLVAAFNRELQTFNWWHTFPKDVLAPADGCGFGIVLTSLPLLRAIAAPHFAWEQFSEDFDFCLKAQQAGFQLYADTGVRAVHLGDPVRVSLETYEDGRDRGALPLGRPLSPAAGHP